VFSRPSSWANTFLGVVIQRVLSITLVGLLSLSFTGCGDSGEKIIQDMIAAMNETSDAIESGDMAKVRTSLAKLKETSKKAKEKKVSKSEDKRLEEKYKSQMEAAMTKMTGSIGKGLASGKLKPEDMKEIGESMSDLK
jgi:biopolymer transport protein ExbB/TolQ